MDKKEKGIKAISGMPMLGIDEDGNLNIDIDAAKKEYKKTKKPKGKGGRPKDPNLQDKKDRLNKEYYQLTQKQGFKSSKAIEILSRKYGWKKSTIETYLK